ncbi:MAG: hypothetical protein US36_C0008G0019 [Candidatus Wolfebacteria bacterium GW2011_GWC1_37_10]|uniref:Uncharacterized protein n=1 Tax=Candidatus Wolfebacteria bacterium GW2011_GWC1_37_10 TaxID=1619010 RepID=A0A0G0FX08_9BACT|nr:MAG: hypothetical protein US36_C0008G0019 [Candidatus Wolfebacteria bacterium GW2011_GWC1_37_10]
MSFDCDFRIKDLKRERQQYFGVITEIESIHLVKAGKIQQSGLLQEPILSRVGFYN